MSAFAAVMTGRGAGAIATIQLLGDSTETILRAIFRRQDGRPVEFAAGRVLLGDLIDANQAIDQVTVGREGPDSFAIHCHGNPLIVERIMGLLQRRGVQPVQAEQLLAHMLMGEEPRDTVTVEAKLALTTVKTIEGASLIMNQTKAGLAATAKRWQTEFDSSSIEQIAAEAKQILKDSEVARLILSGCTIVLVGPPNSGKSTSLNALAGREKAVVTDIPGTTRDWVSAEIRIPPLVATIIDTAGLDPSLGTANSIDDAAQSKSVEMIQRADLILLVLDVNRPVERFSASVADMLACRKTISVLNKSDLPPRLESESLPAYLRHIVRISAKQETGMDELRRTILHTLGVADLEPQAALAFTSRQTDLLRRLSQAASRVEAAQVISELLKGPVSV